MVKIEIIYKHGTSSDCRKQKRNYQVSRSNYHMQQKNNGTSRSRSKPWASAYFMRNKRFLPLPWIYELRYRALILYSVNDIIFGLVLIVNSWWRKFLANGFLLLVDGFSHRKSIQKVSNNNKTTTTKRRKFSGQKKRK